MPDWVTINRTGSSLTLSLIHRRYWPTGQDLMWMTLTMASALAGSLTK